MRTTNHLRACWDCEIPLEGAGTLCASCARHRADGHAPASVIVSDEMGVIPRFCHGAGPHGIDADLLTVAPVPIYIVRWWDEKNPHFYRRAVGA